MQSDEDARRIIALGAHPERVVVTGNIKADASVADPAGAVDLWRRLFGLAPEHAKGEYLGAFDLHVITQNVIGPALLSGLVIAFGFWGWTCRLRVSRRASVSRFSGGTGSCC